QTLVSLQRIMQRQRYFAGEATGQWDDATHAALRRFVGSENFEERTDLEGRTIDRPVFEFLARRFPAH
ncbi:MAG: hypothetical protein MUO23_09475, partial [Anaerolineales bacterium]|nr:hypothetical protein [Anaerolineales bacterium]